jgi:hypothetical protein
MDPQDDLDVLIREASQYGIPPEAMRAIAPVLLRFSAPLPASTYWIPCDAEGQWLLTTLRQSGDAAVQKQVVFAYATAEAAQQETGQSEAVAVLPLLVQLIALEPVDSLVFYDRADSEQGVEIRRAALLRAIAAAVSPNADSSLG